MMVFRRYCITEKIHVVPFSVGVLAAFAVSINNTSCYTYLLLFRWCLLKCYLSLLTRTSLNFEVPIDHNFTSLNFPKKILSIYYFVLQFIVFFYGINLIQGPVIFVNQDFKGAMSSCKCTIPFYKISQFGTRFLISQYIDCVNITLFSLIDKSYRHGEHKIVFLIAIFVSHYKW